MEPSASELGDVLPGPLQQVPRANRLLEGRTHAAAQAVHVPPFEPEPAPVAQTTGS